MKQFAPGYEMKQSKSEVNELNIDSFINELKFNENKEDLDDFLEKDSFIKEKREDEMESETLDDILNEIKGTAQRQAIGRSESSLVQEIEERMNSKLDEIKKRLSSVEQENTFLSVELDTLKGEIRKEIKADTKENFEEIKKEKEIIQQKYNALKKKFVFVSLKLLKELSTKNNENK